MDLGYLKNNPIIGGAAPNTQIVDYEGDYMKNEYRVDYDSAAQLLQFEGKMMMPAADKASNGFYTDSYTGYPGYIYGRQAVAAAYFQPQEGFFPGLARIEKDSADRKHVCRIGDCGRKFKRLEHLKRHQRIHSGERPFCCPIPGCEKKFSRSDNLTQHVRVHLNDPLVAHAADYFLRMRRAPSAKQQL